ncbi:MAG: nucleotidyltransferase domain-containing protein [Candidatus Cloacimonetes bacterium]|nr:nucleotidyltransferase domain-containing protein [Candidatus Cloacimonadota bacterium]
MASEEILARIKAEICRIFPSAKVILYGSRSRGDYDENSDWDLLIILEEKIEENERTELINRLYDLELEIDQLFSPIIHNLSEWKEMEQSPFYRNVISEGKVI